jgi:hypothetical protein
VAVSGRGCHPTNRKLPACFLVAIQPQDHGPRLIHVKLDNRECCSAQCQLLAIGINTVSAVQLAERGTLTTLPGDW